MIYLLRMVIFPYSYVIVLLNTNQLLKQSLSNVQHHHAEHLNFGGNSTAPQPTAAKKFGLRVRRGHIKYRY